MRQFIVNYWLTIILALVTFAILIWTTFGVQNLLNAVNNQVVVDLVDSTPVQPQRTPIATLIPATPAGSFTLENEPGGSILLSSEGEPIYELNSDQQWIPIIPEQISQYLPENSRFVMEEGVWIISSKEGSVLYRWNLTLESWMEARIASSNLSETQTPVDHYSVVNDQFDLDTMISKSDEEIIAMAPQLSPDNYGIEAESLSPTSVLRIGKDEDIPYLLYADDTGRVRMGWNVERSEVEHVEESVYKDLQIPFLVHALVITDNSTVREDKKWYSLHEINRGDLAKAIFEYTLPINYYFRNYDDDFWKKVGQRLDSSGMAILRDLSNTQVDAFVRETRKIFADDLRALTGEERAIIRIGNSSTIQVDNQAIILFRIKLGVRFGTQGGGSSSNITINPQTWYGSDYINAVGGLIVKTLREITIGGNQSFIYDSDNQSGVRSTTEQMVIGLCGDDVINDYLKQIGGKFQNKRIIPTIDRSNSEIPICLHEEHPSH